MGLNKVQKRSKQIHLINQTTTYSIFSVIFQYFWTTSDLCLLENEGKNEEKYTGRNSRPQFYRNWQKFQKQKVKKLCNVCLDLNLIKEMRTNLDWRDRKIRASKDHAEKYSSKLAASSRDIKLSATWLIK